MTSIFLWVIFYVNIDSYECLQSSINSSVCVCELFYYSQVYQGRTNNFLEWKFLLVKKTDHPTKHIHPIKIALSLCGFFFVLFDLT